MITKYVKLVNMIGKYNELEISIDYQKAQTNLFNGNFESGGLYVYIKPIKREREVVSCTLLGSSTLVNGFKVKAIEMSRNNRKKVLRFGDTFTPDILETIREHYETQNFSKIVSIITDMGSHFK